MVDHITNRFAKRFAHWDITLPDKRARERSGGHIEKSGWVIQFCFGRDDKGEFLDYYASHRMTEDEHVRLYADGSTSELPALIGLHLTSNDPVEAQRLEHEYYETNRKIAEGLVAKGFERFTLNMALHAGMDRPADPPSTFGSCGGEAAGIPGCPATLPDGMGDAIAAIAVRWRDSPLRPRPSEAITRAWSNLLKEWVDNTELPLLIRRHRRNRGQVIPHASGRPLVPVDNTPAHWVMRRAMVGECLRIGDIVAAFAGDGIPVAMAMSSTEAQQARYRRKSNAERDLNALGWKICHARAIGMRTPGPIESADIEVLRHHFLAFMDPCNMFLVPKSWAGFGEIPEVAAVFRGEK